MKIKNIVFTLIVLFTGEKRWSSSRYTPRYKPIHHSRNQGLKSKSCVEFSGRSDLPSVSEDVLKTIRDENTTRRVKIGSVFREVRSYGENGVVLMENNEPHTISFKKDSVCFIGFEDGMFLLELSPGEKYHVKIEGIIHEFKLGHPGQELIINEKGYQGFFGGEPLNVKLSNKNRPIRFLFPEPQIEIGRELNFDFLLGKVYLVIQDTSFISLFLDMKQQIFYVDGTPYVLQFINSLQAVLINGVRFEVQFGGRPFYINLKGYRKKFRFMDLPRGIAPGPVSNEAVPSPSMPEIDVNNLFNDLAKSGLLDDFYKEPPLGTMFDIKNLRM